MALERLKNSKKAGYIARNFESFFLGKKFNSYYKKQANNFISFFDKHKDAFVKGAWFPDSVISDNLTGGHTLKIKKPENELEKSKAAKIRNFTPNHLSSRKKLVNTSRLNELFYIKPGYTLPDRCEALSHAIRDMILIQKEEPKGSDILFNDDQITLYFLMLSHYLADAHVPMHCDARDFYNPPTIHPDLESYWDKEIKKYYEFDKKRKVFNYDLNGAPELKDEMKENFKKSFLYKVLQELSRRKWSLSDKKNKYLGEGNNKVYDYVKSVCIASYFISTDFIPKMSKEKYAKIKILKDAEYKEKLEKISVHVLADSIDSIAMVWLLTWDKYNKLKEDVKKRAEEINKQ